jgi:hypothetical protein
MFDVLGLVCGCGGAVLAALVAASLLRLAVSLTNRFVGAAAEPAGPAGGVAAWDWDDWDDEFAGPAGRRRAAGAISEPGLGRSAAVVVAAALAFGLGFLLVGMVGEALFDLHMWREDTKLFVAAFTLPFGLLALTVLLVAALPTTFRRAARVTFVYGLILAGLAAGLAGAVYAAVAVLR